MMFWLMVRWIITAECSGSSSFVWNRDFKMDEKSYTKAAWGAATKSIYTTVTVPREPLTLLQPAKRFSN